MRFKIKLSVNNGDGLLPNNNQYIINSYIHKCIGRNNNYHDAPSNYSISSLQNGILDIKNKNIKINDDSYIIVSSHDTNFIGLLFNGVMSNRNFYNQIIVKSIDLVPDELFYNGYNHFRTLSPFLMRDKNNKDITKNSFNNLNEMSEYVKERVLNRLIKIKENNSLNLNLNNFNLKIEWCHEVKRFVKPGCRGFKTNLCGFTINSSKGVAELLYNIGIGQSTGSGFGTICKAENYLLYRDKECHDNYILNESYSEMEF